MSKIERVSLRSKFASFMKDLERKYGKLFFYETRREAKWLDKLRMIYLLTSKTEHLGASPDFGSFIIFLNKYGSDLFVKNKN